MGDAARHVSPGAGALGGFEVGDIVKGQHIALGLGNRALAGQLHLVDAQVGFVAELDLVAHLATAGRPGAFKDRRQLRHCRFHFLAHQRDFVAPQHGAGAGIDQRHRAKRIQPDNAGRHALHHRLGELAALFIHLVGGQQGFALGLELLRHPVETIGQIAQIATAVLHRNLHIQIAASDAIGGNHQVSDRVDEAVGERDADPQGGQQQHHGQADIHDGEGDLEHHPVRRILPVFGDVLVGQPHVFEHFGFHRPGHE